MWTLNASRAWVHFQSIGYIPATLTAQIVAAALLDLTQLRWLFALSMIAAGSTIPLLIMDAIRGCRKSLVLAV
jgi:hypothetical protein